MPALRLPRALTLAACLLAACARDADPSVRPATTPSAPSSLASATVTDLTEVIYDGALGKGWNDYGWAPRDLGSGPARLDMSRYGGWIIARPGLTGHFGALLFRVAAPAAYGDFLEVRVASDRQDLFPEIAIRAEHRRPLEGGWVQIVVPYRALNPEGLPFDRILIRAAKPIGSERVSLDKIGFTAPDPSDPGLAPSPSALASAPDVPADDVALAIDCATRAPAISPLIYGIAYDPRLDATDQHQLTIGASARRWGGNPASRYNWEHGAAWNTANDWFFENVDYTGKGGAAYADFLRADLDRGMQSALTVPLLGWVAKDTSSNAFPVSLLGAQRQVDPYRTDAGDGFDSTGKPLAAGSPLRTSVASTPDSIRRWIEAIRAADQKRGSRSVHLYILDNEPMLWNSTHRDVHPDPVTYDELLDRTLRYGAAVRAADPDAVIAGPALWGWPAYFFSAKDAAVGFHLKPDRRAHGDVPLLAWYLRELRAHQQKTGTRILDVVDVHFYPQADRVGGKAGGTDAKTSALRIRSTRALWDPTYVDESWIADTIRLIPRMKELIADNYPGLGLAIGEYNFGAEEHISGGLAVAEALGRFGQGGVTAAFYWSYPPDRSPAFWAFRAFRDFDGAGARFLDRAALTTMAERVSLFASRDDAGAHVVAVLLNLRPDRGIRAHVTLTGCAAPKTARAFVYAGSPTGFAATAITAAPSSLTTDALPPSSITVIDLTTESKP